eukprot:CAMPEP_0172510842 /NCGR_PEP_ID=MMETSP1066-20121228/231831_1 /TAXON_ID=671091 /ORGANISM="Coscinodiscus wailesii, Strain CCMP2513" /LENGTH=264 /DNA_ID=CAMNT_0013289995 /DNA_START=214 /DNA_END=1008 /DNA_ORIENTATION=+
MYEILMVCREWNVIGEQAKDLWQTMYHARFQRLGQSMLDIPKSVREWKVWCAHRLGLSMEYNTRARILASRGTGIVAFFNIRHRSGYWGDNILSVRGEEKLQEYNATGWYYFETKIWGQGSVGIVSLLTAEHRNAYGFESENHVGWSSVAYGYHSDDGKIYSNTGGEDFDYSVEPYGPTWGELPDYDKPQIIGCGYTLRTNRLFFTLDGAFLGYFSERLLAGIPYTLAVSLHEYRSHAQVNLGHQPFCFDFDQFCEKHIFSEMS